MLFKVWCFFLLVLPNFYRPPDDLDTVSATSNSVFVKTFKLFTTKLYLFFCQSITTENFNFNLFTISYNSLTSNFVAYFNLFLVRICLYHFVSFIKVVAENHMKAMITMLVEIGQLRTPAREKDSLKLNRVYGKSNDMFFTHRKRS